MGNRMKVSVAIATYNGEKFLAEQLESIVNQSHPVDEIVINDDCSSDRTIDIAQYYAQLYSNISWKISANELNVGYRFNFRKAISRCTGDIIFLCDQDDVWVKNKVAKMVGIFEKNNQVKLLISDFKTINDKGEFLQPNKKLENIWVSPRILKNTDCLEKIKIYEAVSHTQGQGCTMAITREVADFYLKCNLNWTHDNLVGLIAAFRGGLFYLKDQLVNYRIHENNTVGMPIGKWEHSFKEKTMIFLSVCKYCFLKKTSEQCRMNVYNKDGESFEEIERVVGCEESERLDLDNWRKFEKIRLSTIENKKLFQYLLLRIKYREFFELEVPFFTYEQKIVRLVNDIGAIVK